MIKEECLQDEKVKNTDSKLSAEMKDILFPFASRHYFWWLHQKSLTLPGMNLNVGRWSRHKSTLRHRDHMPTRSSKEESTCAITHLRIHPKSEFTHSIQSLHTHVYRSWLRTAESLKLPFPSTGAQLSSCSMLTWNIT